MVSHKEEQPFSISLEGLGQRLVQGQSAAFMKRITLALEDAFRGR